MPFTEGSVPSAHPDAEGQNRPEYQEKAGHGKEVPFIALPSSASWSAGPARDLPGETRVTKGLLGPRNPARGEGAGSGHTASLRPLRTGQHVAGVTKREKRVQDIISRQTLMPKVGKSMVTVLTFYPSKRLLTIYLHFKSL